MKKWFMFNDTATTEIYTLSLHDALPISEFVPGWHLGAICEHLEAVSAGHLRNLLINIPPRHMKSLAVSVLDRKSTRLNSSHAHISYAVFCLKKKTPLPFPRAFFLI